MVTYWIPCQNQTGVELKNLKVKENVEINFVIIEKCDCNVLLRNTKKIRSR